MRNRTVQILFFLGFSLSAGIPLQAAIDDFIVGDASIHQTIMTQMGLKQYGLQTISIPSGKNERLELSLRLGSEDHRLVLYSHSVRAAGFRVSRQIADGSLVDVGLPPSRTFRGYLEDMPGSQVQATVSDGRVDARITLPGWEGQVWIVKPLSGLIPGDTSGRHIVYRAEDVVGPGGTCATPNTPTPDVQEELPPPPGTAPLDVLVCEMACDADVEYYALNGCSVDATVADIESVINGVSAIFERDIKVTFQITGIIVRTAEPDPYDTTNPYVLLGEISDDWTTNHRDIPHDLVELFTGRTLAGGIGIADMGTLCNGYSIVQSRYYSDLVQRVSLSAHEIGHNFDAAHCDDMDIWCRIMCPSMGGCSGANQSFGPWEIKRLRAGMARKTCLSSGTVDIPVTTLPFFDDFSYVKSSYGQIAPLDETHGWTAADRAEAICDGPWSNFPKYMLIEIERAWNLDFTKYGTVRTLPMVLDGIAKVAYKVCQNDVQAGQMLKVEYFNSSLWQWQPLESISSNGVQTNNFVLHEASVPADGIGPYFAVRFSAYGDSVATRSCRWYVDDVSITELSNPADINGDKKVNLEDWAICAAAWLSQESDPSWNPACNLKQPPDTIINLDDFKVWVENWLRTL